MELDEQEQVSYLLISKGNTEFQFNYLIKGLLFSALKVIKQEKIMSTRVKTGKSGQAMN